MSFQGSNKSFSHKEHNVTQAASEEMNKVKTPVGSDKRHKAVKELPFSDLGEGDSTIISLHLKKPQTLHPIKI